MGVIDSLRRKQLTGQKDPAIRDRAAKIFAASAVGNRGAVYEDYKSVAGMPGKAANGHQIFLKVCANCHRLDREGTPVGPDLFGIRNQPKEAILLHILIPEYEITPGYGAYLNRLEFNIKQLLNEGQFDKASELLNNEFEKLKV